AFDALTFLPHQQGDRLVPRANRHSATPLDGGLDLAHAASEHGQDAVVVDLSTTLSTGGSSASTALLTSIGHGFLLAGCDVRQHTASGTERGMSRAAKGQVHHRGATA